MAAEGIRNEGSINQGAKFKTGSRQNQNLSVEQIVKQITKLLASIAGSRGETNETESSRTASAQRSAPAQRTGRGNPGTPNNQLVRLLQAFLQALLNMFNPQGQSTAQNTQSNNIESESQSSKNSAKKFGQFGNNLTGMPNSAPISPNYQSPY